MKKYTDTDIYHIIIGERSNGKIAAVKQLVDKARKETAKEILDMLYDMGVDKGMCEYCRTFDVNGVSLAEQICEKYGVDMWI